jgi:hypothetical protein
VKFNIVDIEDIEDIENGDFLKLWEDFVFSNIIRFRIGGLMNDYPVSFIAE